MIPRLLHRLADPFKLTPLHPQWLVFFRQRNKLNQLSRCISGKILDIGCGHQQIKNYLAANTEYIGLDYYQTATEWYHSRPAIYGNAEQLPIISNSMDAVLLLDVLEHLPDPHACLCEAHRVLKTGGTLIIQTPFMYPVHDAPLDFQRWTTYGLRTLAQSCGFEIDQIRPLCSTPESIALIINIGVSRMVIDWGQRHHPLTLLSLLLPVIITSSNLLAWLLSFTCRPIEFMAHGLQMFCHRRP